MLNFDFKKSSRKCYDCEREFKPGEDFYSALVESDEGTERRDFAIDSWNGPPDDCIGWWKSRVPDLGKGRVYWAPKHVLLAFFEHVHSNVQTADVAFVTALLLAQKRILSLEDDGGDSSRLVLRNRASKTDFEVPVVELSASRLKEIQNELSERLFMDQPIGLEPDEEVVND